MTCFTSFKHKLKLIKISIEVWIRGRFEIHKFKQKCCAYKMRMAYLKATPVRNHAGLLFTR